MKAWLRSLYEWSGSHEWVACGGDRPDRSSWPCDRRNAGLRGRLPEPPGALADRLFRRWPGRRGGAHHGQLAVGAFRPAIRGREPHRLGRQYRGGRRHQLAAGRLHDLVCRAQQRDLDLALQASQLRFPPRHRAGRQHHAAPQHAGGLQRDAGEERSGVHRLLQGRSEQGYLSPRRASARRCTCRANCSRP